MIQFMDKISNWIADICNVLATILCAGIAVVVFLGVVFRYALNMPLAWGEEVPKYLMVWMTFVGAPVVLRYGTHVSLNAWHEKIGNVPRKILRFFISVFCCLLLMLFIYYGWNSAVIAKQQKMILVGNLSMFWVYLSIPAGSFLFLIMLVIDACKEFASIFQHEDP
jgi:TRAP-type C4-dicarboxylate transport system permease small subunit